MIALTNKPKLPDDRGRVFHMAREQDAWSAGIDTATIPRPVGEDRAKYRFQAIRAFSTGGVLFWILWIPIYSIVWKLLVQNLGISGWVAVGMILVIFIPATWVCNIFSNRATAHALRDLLKYNFFCAVCLFELERLDRKPDGCTICPECGAAWKLPPIHESEPASGETGSG